MDLVARQAIMELEGNESALLDEYSNPKTEKYSCMIDCIKKKLNFTSLKYQNLCDMIEAIGLPEDSVCTYCWNGKE
jgi:amidophosphoribosyltransferase